MGGRADGCAAQRIDHATIAVAGGLGRDGRGAAILMRDVRDDLVPPGDAPLSLAAHTGYLDDLAALSARMLGWRDEIGLVPRPPSARAGPTAARPIRLPVARRTWYRA